MAFQVTGMELAPVALRHTMWQSCTITVVSRAFPTMMHQPQQVVEGIVEGELQRWNRIELEDGHAA